MEEVRIEGTIILPVGEEVLRVDYLTWRNRAWLSPIYLETPNGHVRPLRLIAPRFAPGYKPLPGPEVLNIFQQMPLTKAVLEQGFIPADLANLVEIVENPNVRIQNPPAN